MGWIKRNLLFVISSVVALALLGAAGYYTFKSWNHNRDAMANLQAAYTELQNDATANPTPSEDNINAAREQEQDLRAWINQAQAHFAVVQPIPNPPDGVITTEAFAGALRKTIYDMQQEAADANVLLPPDYSFSFAAERNLVTFSPGSLNPLASHLGEVKAICEVLFAAKVNALDGVQREMVSDNDTAGPQSDYLTDKTRTTDLTTVTPYMITFRCFSSDLANVMAKMATSEHCFVITGINVMPAGAAAAQGGESAAPAAAPTPGLPQGNGVLQTVLDEQLLRVTMGLEVVKLTKQ
jgi:hypothetical protein